MKWKWITWMMLVAVACVCIWVSFWHFHPWHVSLPGGCDQFGYLYQAEAIRNGDLFEEHTPRPFMDGLVTRLSSSFPHYRDYSFIVAPHAYHFDEHAGKVINQYPPGTALFLSGFPTQYRQFAYPALMTFLMCAMLLLLRKLDGWRLAAAGSLVICYAVAIMAVPGGRFFYDYVGSEAPIIPFLIAAGWFLRTRPLVSLALISFTVLFRIADVWLLPIVALPALFTEWLDGDDLPALRTLLIRAAKIGSLCFACGIAWLLLYQWIYLGAPLRTTYPDYDQELAKGAKIVGNLSYYFVDRPISAIITAVAFAGVVLLYFGKGRRWVILWSFLLVVWNYVFFVTHQVHTEYYPFAVAYVLFGLCLAGLDVLGKNMLRVTTILFAVVALCLLHEIWPNKNTRSAPLFGNMQEQVATYRQAFGRADVVWASEHSSTVEYALNIPAFRPKWGHDDAAVIAMQWLRGKGYRQAFYLDDSGVDSNAVLELVHKSGLGMTILTDPKFGRVGWIEPAAK